MSKVDRPAAPSAVPSPVAPRPAADVARGAAPGPAAARAGEIGGPKGPEPTRYGDWERDGRCVDF